MNASDLDDGDRLGTALREHLGSASPDLEALTASAMRRGGRIRRARWTAAGLGVAAVVAAGSLGAAALAGGGPTSAGTPSLFGDSSAPSASAPAHPLAVGDTIHLPSGVVAKVYELGKPIPPSAWPSGMASDVAVPAVAIPSDLAASGPVDHGLFVIAPGATDADFDWMRAQYGNSTVPILVTRGPSDESEIASGPTPSPTPGD